MCIRIAWATWRRGKCTIRLAAAAALCVARPIPVTIAKLLLPALCSAAGLTLLLPILHRSLLRGSLLRRPLMSKCLRGCALLG